MNWEDEDFVKLYTRDTPEFLLLSWQARCLLSELIRKVDRAGVLDCGKLGLVKGIAVALRAPWQELEPFVNELLADGRIVFDAGRGQMLIPNHIDAQSARQSDKQRQRKSRASKRADVLSRTEANRDSGSRNDPPGQHNDPLGHDDPVGGHTREEIREEERRSPLPPSRDLESPENPAIPPLDLPGATFDIEPLGEGVSRDTKRPCKLNGRSTSELNCFAQGFALLPLGKRDDAERDERLRRVGTVWSRWCEERRAPRNGFKFLEWVNGGAPGFKLARPAPIAKPAPPVEPPMSTAEIKARTSEVQRSIAGVGGGVVARG